MEPKYEVHLALETAEVDLKKNVRWFGLDIPVTTSPFALRRIIFRAMRDLVDQGFVQRNAMTHLVPTVMRFRMPVFNPGTHGDTVKVVLGAKRIG